MVFELQPGPKSGHTKRSYTMPWRYLWLHAYLALMMTWCGGEGWGLVTESPEADESVLDFSHLAANPCDTMPSLGSGLNVGPLVKQTSKRAFKRACSRAIRLGFAWYKGQCLTPDDFPQTLRHTCETQPQPTRALTDVNPPLMHKPRKRLSTFHWNCSGMTVAKLDELKLWLQHQQLDIAAFSETRWQYTNEWTDDTWSYIHSGCNSERGSGVLLLIRRGLCSAQDFSWHEVITGRVLHVRLQHATRPVDLILCYQSPKDLHGMCEIGFRCDTFPFPILQKKLKLLNFN